MRQTPDLEARPNGVWWRPGDRMVRTSISAVRAIGVATYMSAGASEKDARFLVDCRLNKAIQGDFARGRFEQWVDMPGRAERGELTMRPTVTPLRESPATALLDNVPGAPKALMCRAAMDLAIEKARDVGVGLVSVRTAAEFTTTNIRQAVDAGLVGMVMTQSFPLVAPHGGIRPMLGDAPIGIGVPAGEKDPVILDMSLTNSSATNVRFVAAGQLVADGHEPGRVAPGLLLDENGEPTTDANALFHDGPADRRKAKGSLLPLGSGHKGYALVFAVTLLSSVLTMTNFPWEAEEVAPGGIPVGEGTYYGSLHIAIDPGMFMDPGAFTARVDQFIDDLQHSPRGPGAGEILYPGEKSQRIRREREQVDSFLLPPMQYEAVCRAADALGLDRPPGA